MQVFFPGSTSSLHNYTPFAPHTSPASRERDYDRSKRAGLDSMPLDVLEIIFIYFLGPRPDSPNADSRYGPGRVCAFAGTYTTPITLCHINSYLRRVALQLSCLWSNIYIYNISVEQLNMVQFWLDNLKSRPFHLSIAIYRHTTHAALKLTKSTEMLFKVSNQWESLSLRVAAFASGHFFSGLRAEQLTNLNKVFFHLEEWKISHRDELFYALAGAPSLQQIGWPPTMSGSRLPVHTPWSRFKCLTLEGPFTLQGIRVILEGARSLQMLRLGELYKYQELQSHRSISVSAHSVTLTSPLIISNLLPTLSFPMLSELHIDVNNHMYEKQWNVLTNLITDHNSPPITKFMFSGPVIFPAIPVGWTRILSILEHSRMAQLVQLVLHMRIYDDIIIFITHWPVKNNGTGIFHLPCLQTLSLSRCSVRRGGMIGDMVLSRCPNQSPSQGQLRHVDVTVRNTCSFVQDEDMFKELRSAGLSAHLTIW